MEVRSFKCRKFWSAVALFTLCMWGAAEADLRAQIPDDFSIGARTKSTTRSGPGGKRADQRSCADPLLRPGCNCRSCHTGVLCLHTIRECGGHKWGSPYRRTSQSQCGGDLFLRVAL